MNWPLETILRFHISIMVIVLLITAGFLIQKGLFRWDKSGFWALVSFLLYFVLNPLFSLFSGNLSIYAKALKYAGGTERGWWILFVTVLGIIAFFTAYLHTRSRIVSWKLRGDQLTMPMLVALFILAGFGIYSMLTQRAHLISTEQETIIEGGRFTGQVTGYQNAGYVFLLLPLTILLLSRSRLSNLLGILGSGLFVLLALPSGWSRFVLVSVLIMVSLVSTLKHRSPWPRWYFLPLLLVFIMALQLRGHTQWSFSTGSVSLFEKSQQVIEDLGTNIVKAVGSPEVSALSTWYLESYVVDKYYGYSFGLPVINYLLTGWLPSRLFPQKYFLIDWLASQRHNPGPSICQLLYGAKSTLLGGFYSEGGVFGVIILAVIAGLLSRKLDGMVHPQAPLLVRATGILWMSILWMVWQSSDTWAIMTLGSFAIPSVSLWALAPKMKQKQIFDERNLVVRLPGDQKGQ